MTICITHTFFESVVTLARKRNGLYTYSQYEIGVLNYPIETLIKLAIFYNTSVDYLLRLTDNPTPYERSKSKN